MLSFFDTNKNGSKKWVFVLSDEVVIFATNSANILFS